jgi:hypothetical protein
MPASACGRTRLMGTDDSCEKSPMRALHFASYAKVVKVIRGHQERCRKRPILKLADARILELPERQKTNL